MTAPVGLMLVVLLTLSRDLVKERRLLQEVYEGGEAELAHLPSRRQSLKLQNQVARQDNKGPGCGLNSAASANVC